MLQKVPISNYRLGLAAALSTLFFWHASSLANPCDTLTGTYVCETYCPTEGIGGHDQVVQNGQELQLTDGKGAFKGYVSGSKTLIVARIWKENPLKGTLNADCSEIVWTNGSVWVRKK